MKIGFELELFCTKPDPKHLALDTTGPENYIPCLVPNGLPYDECGWLVEVRSEPHSDIGKAIALFDAEINAVYRKASRLGVTLLREPLLEVPRELKVAAARKYTKGKIAYQNIYGYETHRCSTKFATAALHISVTNTQEQKVMVKGYLARQSAGWLDRLIFGSVVATNTEKVIKYSGFIDHAKLIGRLDLAFKDEIREAKRNPGFYEVKSDGRIEYRSLPNNVDLGKLQTELEKIFPAS